MSDEEDKGFITGLKEKIGDKLDKVTDIKDSVVEKISDVKDSTQENVGIAKELASYQGNNMKSEGQFLKDIQDGIRGRLKQDTYLLQRV